jgi:hypothetical protein
LDNIACTVPLPSSNSFNVTLSVRLSSPPAVVNVTFIPSEKLPDVTVQLFKSPDLNSLVKVPADVLHEPVAVKF